MALVASPGPLIFNGGIVIEISRQHPSTESFSGVRSSLWPHFTSRSSVIGRVDCIRSGPGSPYCANLEWCAPAVATRNSVTAVRLHGVLEIFVGERGNCWRDVHTGVKPPKERSSVL